MFLLLLLLLGGSAYGSWWPWSSGGGEDTQTPAVPAMVNVTVCSGSNFSRTDAWSCFLKMGDGQVPGHAKDGDLDFVEIEYGIKTHLTWYEKVAAPSATGILERCDADKDNVVKAAEYASNTNPGCIGTASDLCHVHGVCIREFP